MSTVVIPAEIVSTRRAFLDLKIGEMRRKMEKEINADLNDEIGRMPRALLNLSVREFLLLNNVLEHLNISEQTPRRSSISKRKRLEDTGEIETNLDPKRRVTRSMARNSSIYIQSTIPIPSTPQLHPLLPETPAMLRKAIKLAGENDTQEEFKRPVRIARSTIRATNDDQSKNFFKAPMSRKSVRQSHANSAKEVSALEGDSNVVSLELSDGKVLDVDLSKSPKSMLKGLGSEAVKEVKNKMQAYAAQLRSFFKKLNF
jgi:hypothetical protein